MAASSMIEWTDATWNPITGCSVTSPGCTHCYAMKLAGGRLRHEPTRAGLTRETAGGPVWNGDVRFNEGVLDQPLRWGRPRKIFVCAHGDLFHENVPYVWIDAVLAVAALCPQHVFQVLTKRPARMRDYFINHYSRHKIGVIAAKLSGKTHDDGHGCDPSVCNHPIPLPNLWLGVSAENQATADERIPELLAIPKTVAAVRWVSFEPLLGPINLRWTNYAHAASGETYRQPLERTGSVNAYEGLRKIDWAVVGGESGPQARPMHPAWARTLRDQCSEAGVPFFFKQWGSHRLAEIGTDGEVSPAVPLGADFKRLQVCAKGAEVFIRPAPDTTVEIVFRPGNVIALPASKRDTGRLLDGVQHDGYPQALAQRGEVG